MGASTSRLYSIDTPVVEIPGHGLIRGTSIIHTLTGRPKAHRYTGIPYALPPIGKRRWRKPSPLHPSFQYDALDKVYTHFGDICPQPGNFALNMSPSPPIPKGRSFSEDCLLVNIWVPAGKPPTSGYPVLFFLHGGWLQVGNAHHDVSKDPSDLISAKEEGGAGVQAIIVVPGYRLGVFGFLAMESMPQGERGNFGFYDQRLALEWTFANIAAFGGNRNNITLGGLSAGAHSAHSQALFEFNQLKVQTRQPLFRRLFLQSNAAMLPQKTLAETKAQRVDLCRQLGIREDINSDSCLAALRERSADELMKVVQAMELHTFRAVRGKGEFVDVTWPSDMLDGGFASWCKHEGIELLIGECATEESVYRLCNPPTGPDFHASLLRQLYNYYPTETVQRLLKCYSIPASASSAKEWMDVFGIVAADSQVYASERLLIDIMRAHDVPVFRYHISYRPQFLDAYFPREMGVGHGFDDQLWWYFRSGLFEPASMKDADRMILEHIYHQWLDGYTAFIWGSPDAQRQWYGGDSNGGSAQDAIQTGRAVRYLGSDLSISVKSDEHWVEKAAVIDCIRQYLIECTPSM